MNSAPVNRPKILFVAEGVTLAHVGRALRLASILHAFDFDVEFACDPRYARFVAHAPFPVRHIVSLAPEVFMDALRRGRPVFSAAILAAEVLEDLKQFEDICPDAVVGDFRLSLSVSARVAGIPYANVTNAYWSPYAQPRFVMPSLPFTRFLNTHLADPLFRLARPIAFALHARPLNDLRRTYGLEPLPHDVRHAYCDGDSTLYADSPHLIPVTGCPPSHRYIGPVLWSVSVERPPWWSDALSADAPIYVSLGSSGSITLLPSIVEELAALGRTVVVATAGRFPRQTSWPARVFSCDFLPGAEITARACVVVCNGGSLTTQQALTCGVPVIGIASNLDQHLNMEYVERAGAGIRLRADRVSAKMVLEAVRGAIDDVGFRTRASTTEAAIASPRVEQAFPAAIRWLLPAVR